MVDKSAKGKAESIRNIPIVFIVGLGRSGTTLLQERMNSHPNVVGPPEYNFMVYLHSRFGNKKHWTKTDVLDFIEALYFRRHFSIWMVSKEKLTEELLAIAEYADYPLICKMLLYQMANGKENILLFSDKNPEYSLHIKTLLKIFPEARFIHIIRDPRDNVNSQIRSFKKKNVYYNAWRWKRYNIAIEKAKKRMPLKFHTVLYENLVTDTERNLVALCEFLNIPFNASIMENHFPERLYAIKEDKVLERVKGIHKGLLNPINSSNIRKWEKEMSPENIAITEAITGNLAHFKYGYVIREREDITKQLPYFKIFKGWIFYQAWEYYTKLRYKNYKFNKSYYARKMKLHLKDT